jgi:hypothetical protein
MSRSTFCTLGLFCFFAPWIGTENAHGQQLLMPRVGGYNTVQVAPLPNPVVSPYLLMTDVGQSGVLNYQTLVQPLMQQQIIANQQNAAISRLGQQVQQPARQAPAKRSGQTGRDTGHAASYFNYSHYYNSVAR